MSEQEVQKINGYLHEWHTRNKHLMKHTITLPVIYFNGTQIMIDLNALSVVYHEKFLIGQLGAYANNFLEVISPGIISFLNKESISMPELVFHFKFMSHQLVKHVNIPLSIKG